MFSNQTPNYGLPQWQNDDTPTWLVDMNEAFANIDANLKRVEDKADEGGVPQEIIDRIVALETSVSNVLIKIGTDVIDTIGTSITNAIVNLKSAIDTATTNITNIINNIGNIDISDVGNSITQAIRNLADTEVPQTIIDRIVTLETSVANITTKIGNVDISQIATSITDAIVILFNWIEMIATRIDELERQVANILVKIGTDVIDTVGTSITNAIVNLKSAIDTATTNITSIINEIGDTNISDVGNSITQAIRNLADAGVPQTIIDRIVALETSVTNILTQIGADAISGIGTSITNAIVNLNTSITTATNNITTIIAQIGTDIITEIGTSITNAIVNLKNRIDNIMTLIGNTDISEIGTSITNAIVNLNSAIENKQEKINDNDILTTPTENDVLSGLRNNENKIWTFSLIWDFIKGKISSIFYPIGTVIFNIGTNPSDSYGGTWELYATGTKALYLDATAGLTVNEELPNIKGEIKEINFRGSSAQLINKSGAFINSVKTNGNAIGCGTPNGDVIKSIKFDASDSSTVYKDNGKVRAEGKTICAWVRIA